MAQRYVIVNDYYNKIKTEIMFSDNDFETVEKSWTEIDPRLVNLQGLASFSGYDTWEKCTIAHYRILIERTIALLDDMDKELREKSNNPIVNTFNFLIVCMMKKLEISGMSKIELLRINRITKTDLSFDYSASMELFFDMPNPLLTKDNDDVTFKIIVDNSMK